MDKVFSFPERRGFQLLTGPSKMPRPPDLAWMSACQTKLQHSNTITLYMHLLCAFRWIFAFQICVSGRLFAVPMCMADNKLVPRCIAEMATQLKQAKNISILIV